MDLTVNICVALSNAKQGGGEDVAGAKTETDATGAATKAVSEYVVIQDCGGIEQHESGLSSRIYDSGYAFVLRFATKTARGAAVRRKR